MICRQCGAQSDVIDSRPRREGLEWRRRYRCRRCSYRFTTVEIPAEQIIRRLRRPPNPPAS